MNKYKVTYLEYETIKAIIIEAHDIASVTGEMSKLNKCICVGNILKIEVIIDDVAVEIIKDVS